MIFLKAFGGCLAGAVTGIIAAIVYVFFIWPKLKGGVDWDALGPGAMVMVFQLAIVLALVGGVLGAFIAVKAAGRRS